MSTKTSNLSLILPERTDKFNIKDFNDNFTIIDTEVAARLKNEANSVIGNNIASGSIASRHINNILDSASITSNQSKIPSSYAVLTALASKADMERGTITSDNYAWYSRDAGMYDKKMEGTYQLIGDYCFLSVTAQRIQGWGTVYYSLPVAAIAAGAAAAVSDVNYTVNTSFQQNISVLEINKADRSTMSAGELYFTLIYKYK